MLHPFHSDRLHIREIESTDVGDIYLYRSLPEIAKYQYWEPYSMNDAVCFVDRCLKSRHLPYEWSGYAIVLNNSTTLIGDCALKINLDNTAEIGCNISPNYQRYGYAKEALSTLFKHCYDAKIEKMYGIVDSRNQASISLMQSLNMIKDSSFEEMLICKGEKCIEYRFVIEKSGIISILDRL